MNHEYKNVIWDFTKAGLTKHIPEVDLPELNLSGL